MEVNCNICNKVIDHAESFFDDEEDVFICLNCQEERIKRLLEATPGMLLYLIRLCHPNEKGEPYTRWEIIEEIQKRGTALLKELGWPDKDDSVYKNRYTGDEQTLKNIYTFEGYFFEHILSHELPFVMENWSPKELWTNEGLLDCYKRNPKLTEFFGGK